MPAATALTLAAGALLGAVTALSYYAPAVSRLRRALETDGLTGLGNRHALATHAASAAAGAAVMLLDLDGFKPINDVHGHAAGDQALTEFARRLRAAAAAAGGRAFRMGGDEFVVFVDLHPAADPAAAARMYAAGLYSGVAGRWPLPGGGAVDLRPSIGVTAGDPRRLPDLLAAADAAMFTAKRAAGGVAYRPLPAPDGAAPARPAVRRRDLRRAARHAPRHRAAS